MVHGTASTTRGVDRAHRTSDDRHGEQPRDRCKQRVIRRECDPPPAEKREQSRDNCDKAHSGPRSGHVRGTSSATEVRGQLARISRVMRREGQGELLPRRLTTETGVAVVVVGADEGPVTRTLSSIAKQTLGAGRRRVVEVAPRPNELRLALAGASEEYVTVLAAGDTLSPDYLEVALSAADPHGLVLGRLAVGDPSSRAPLDFGTPVGREGLRYEGTTTRFVEAPLLAAAGSGAILPAPLAKRGAELLRGDTFLPTWVWLELLMSDDPPLHVAQLADHLVVYRPHPALTEGAEPGALGRFLDTASRLEDVPADRVHEQAATVLRKHLASELGALSAHGVSLHSDVLAHIRQRQLENFPLSTFTAGASRDLVIAYGFPPTGGTSGAVVARRIYAKGVPVDVISNDMTDRRGVDESVEQIARDFVGRHVVVRTRPTLGNWSRIARFCERGIAAIESTQREKGPYRSVFSRAMWPASHALAALYKGRYPGVPWEAEFSDPLLMSSRGEVRYRPIRDDALLAELREALERSGQPVPTSDNVFVWLEHLAYALADRIVFTNARQRDYMLHYTASPELRSRVHERSVIEPQPMPPGHAYELVQSSYPLEPGLMNIGYFGAFYAVRGASDILEGLAGLTAEDRRRLCVHVFTRDPSEVKAAATRLGVASNVRSHPYLPYLEFLNLASRMDLLVVADAHTSGTHGINPYLPSKLSEYLGSGTAIWAIVEPGSTLDEVHEGLKSVLGDRASATAALEEALARSAAPPPTSSSPRGSERTLPPRFG